MINTRNSKKINEMKKRHQDKKDIKMLKCSRVAQQVKNLTSIPEDAGLISGLTLCYWCCLKPWHRLAAAAPTGSLAWKLPYATGVFQKKKKKTTIKPRAGPL